MFWAVLFAVFKFILKLVLVLFCIILLLTLIILLSAIKYDVNTKTGDLFTDPKNIRARVKVAWLFSILRFDFVYIKNEARIRIFLFGLQLKGRKKKRLEDTEIVIASDDPKLSPDRPEESVQEAPDAKPEEEPKENVSAESTEAITEEKTEKKKKIKRKKIKKKNENKSDSDKEDGLLSKIKYVYNYPDRKKITDGFFKMLKRIFKHLKPKHFDFDMVLGLDDPYTTGKIIGSVAAVSGILKKESFLQGSFSEKMARIKLDVNGRVRLGSLLWSALRFVFYIPVLKVIIRLIKQYFKSRKNK